MTIDLIKGIGKRTNTHNAHTINNPKATTIISKVATGSDLVPHQALQGTIALCRAKVKVKINTLSMGATKSHIMRITTPTLRRLSEILTAKALPKAVNMNTTSDTAQMDKADHRPLSIPIPRAEDHEIINGQSLLHRRRGPNVRTNSATGSRLMLTISQPVNVS